MSDETKVLSLLISCIALVVIVCCNLCAINERKFIEAGYVQVQKVGETGTYWVKP